VASLWMVALDMEPNSVAGAGLVGYILPVNDNQ
jgi:hypothetical protein